MFGTFFYPCSGFFFTAGLIRPVLVATGSLAAVGCVLARTLSWFFGACKHGTLPIVAHEKRENSISFERYWAKAGTCGEPCNWSCYCLRPIS